MVAARDRPDPRAKRALGGVPALAVCLLLLAPPSARAVTFGDSLGIPAGLITVAPPCGEPCTLATTISPGHLAWFRSPVDGTIVRWRLQTGSGSAAQMVRLRVISPLAGEELGEGPSEAFSGAGTGEAVAVPTTAGTFTFPTRLPVQAGDFIGLDTQGGALAALAAEEESIRVFKPPLSDLGAAVPGAHENLALLLNADVVPPPASGAIAACSSDGEFDVTVTAYPDPVVGASALHARVDGGPELVLALHGAPAVAQIPVSSGAHEVEYWAQDTLGQLEANHHLAAVIVDAAPPSVTISSDQGRAVYAQGQRASVSVRASAPPPGLASDPTATAVPLATDTPGGHTFLASAIDRCGRSASASFSYVVTAAPRLAGLRVRPRSFRAGAQGPTVVGFGGAARPGGATVSYSDSQRALAEFEIQRAAGGVLRAGRCLRSRASHPGARCTRWITIALFMHSDRAGADRFRFSGRVAGTPLAPGTYRLRVAAAAPGGRPGAPAYAVFVVLGS